ncbi:DUF4157 domain-containing protein [Rhodovulum steppense]|uniref:Uncharacterized protein DUF4157 n=1 Tax=Rhodovulum steppense TaxID=540251 RepID=A0A4V2R4J5_9RHOB|nr:DUF4157 domain-containing protein [Rhodovulum steppense]TCM85034.1 uncharacterized protein DUF4157 [Rhodovulum steppense]
MTHAPPQPAQPATAARVQTKPMLGRPGDRFEQEADRIADAVTADRPTPLTGPLPVTPLIQRQSDETGADDRQSMATAKAAAAVANGGRPLSPAERRFFEPRFGRDLSAVRLHEGTRAGAAARGIGARAYTLGQNIALAPGEYAPETREGRHLMAHELTHTLQQGKGVIRRTGEEETAPVRPTQIDFNFDQTKAIPAAAGGTARLTASTNGTEVTWSIADGTATKAQGTTIGENGTITLAADQTGGSLTVRAANSAGTFSRTFYIASIPTGIETTTVASDLTTSADDYGAAFQHVFTSNEGSQNVLTNLRIGERFPGAPNPTGATHAFSGRNWPFGRGRDSFTLHTGTLANDAAGSWALTDTGEFGPTSATSGLADGDNVSTHRDLIKVGDHVQSHSNPRPTNRLPVTLTLDQQFHFFNPRAASGSRWTRFTTTAHSRTLRRSGTDVEFVTTVNGIEHVEDYSGPPAVTNLTASPVNTPKSASPPPPSAGSETEEAAAAPAPRTVSLRVEALPGTLPAGTSLDWTIVPPDLGCTIAKDPSDETRATLTIGTAAGTVTVQVADNTGTNSDRVEVRIT